MKEAWIVCLDSIDNVNKFIYVVNKGADYAPNKHKYSDG